VSSEDGKPLGGSGIMPLPVLPECLVTATVVGIVAGYPGVLGVSDLIELFPRIF